MPQSPALDIGNAVAARLLADAQVMLDRDPVQVRACLDQLASLLAGEPFGAVARPPAPVRGGLAPWQVRRVTAHVAAHLGERLPVSDLAGLVRLSNSHFCRAFKATVGTTPHTYIVQRRLEHAQYLMLTTGETLSQIAATCGLTDQAHLTRLFRRYVGDTPFNWRRTWRRSA